MRRKFGGQLQMIKRIACIFIIFMLLSIQVYQGNGSQLTDYQNQFNQNKSNISSYTKNIKKIEDDINWNKHKRDLIVKELEELGLKKEVIEQHIELLESTIASLDAAIELAEQEYAEQQELLKERLRVMYKRSTTVWEIEQLLKSKSLNEAFLRIKLMKQITGFDQSLLESIESKRLEIEELKEQKQIEIDSCVEQAMQLQKDMDERNISRATLVTAINKDINTKEKYIKQQDDLIKESKDLENLIKNLESLGGEYIGGDLVWPMPTNKYVASEYGNRIHPIYKVWKMHTGVDIGSKWNEHIVAAGDGTVIYVGARGGYGNTIIIDHGDGITTLYAHINSRGFMVKNGQKVKAGDVIAKAGMTGTATGPHLHFEVRKNGATQNPLKYVKP
jgi:septal ring factor EnvC (AmiA/AmiB activator)